MNPADRSIKNWYIYIMNRWRFCVLIAISVVALCSATVIHHNYKQQENTEDFLRGMGITVMVGAMALATKSNLPTKIAH